MHQELRSSEAEPIVTEARFRQLYEELLESDTRFRTMADHAPVLLWMSGTDSLCTFFNQQWLTFTGRPLEAEMGTGWAEGVHAEDFQRCMDTYLAAFVARRPFRMEYRLRRADQQYRWVLDQGVPRYAPGGAFVGYIGSCVDVTELREATEAQRRVSRQLQVLVQELQHRVKNNLQLISSLLNLQLPFLDDPTAHGILRETQARIRSIALLHERLYESGDLERIEAKAYFAGILGGLRSTFGASGPQVTLSVQADGLVLGIDTALPCGLIVNELVTNAYKYAFAASVEHQRIDVAFSHTDSGILELVVADNGVGLPPTVERPPRKTLGLQLVRSLARQLSAELTLSCEGGTAWTLRIPAADTF
jgi:two-component system, sensor histidine kinase PdtaS